MFIWLFNYIRDTIFPKQCLECSAWSTFICLECRCKITPNKIQRCIECHKPSLLGITHPKCRTKFSPDRLVTVFNYQNSMVKKAITVAKIAMVPELLSELSSIAVSHITLSASCTQNNFVLCPIPTSRYKQRLRGFNSSTIIACYISNYFNLAVDNLLKKSNFIKQQKLLNKQQRHSNIRNAFLLPTKNGLPSYVILIDDVTTTGATFKEAARILKKHGIVKVWCLALAQD